MKKYSKKIKEFTIKSNGVELESCKIESADDANEYIRKFYNDIDVFESFFLLILNRANNVVGYAKISQGGVCGTVVDTKIIAKYCVDTLASAVILAHNHPSGNLKPSSADINITKKIKSTLELFDCKVLDHVILTTDNYYSFANENMI